MIPTPTAVENVTAQHVVSSFNVHKPAKINKLFRAYGQQGESAFQHLISMGFKSSVNQTTYSHFEELLYHDSFKLDPAADPGAGADLVVDLAADSIDANSDSFPRVGDVVMNPTTEVVGRVMGKTAGNQLTIKPNRSTENLGAVLQDDEWVIISSAFAEGMGQPSGAVPKTQELDNYTQIIKETTVGTGTEMTNATWFDMREDGASTPSYWSVSLLRGEYSHLLKCDGALLFNKERTNTTMTEDSKNIDQTKGLVPSFRERAYVYPTADFDVADFNAVDRNLTKNFAAQHICAWAAIDRHQQIEDNLQDYFKDANINSTRVVASEAIYGAGEDGHALAASVNFKFLLKSERGWMIKRLHAFDHPKTYNTPNSPLVDMAIFFPANKTMDGKGKLRSHIGMRWKELAGKSRMIKTWYDGAMAPVPIGEIDQARYMWLSDIGFHGVNLNQCVLVTN